MNFDLHLKNVGKLTDAKIRIGRFTVFAGPNNTGKSFVSKVLYSLFTAMNQNPAEVYINNLVYPIFLDLRNLEGDSDEADRVLSQLHEGLQTVLKMVTEVPAGDFEKLEKIIPNLIEKVRDMKEEIPNIRFSLESLATKGIDPENTSDISYLAIEFQEKLDFLDGIKQYFHDMEVKLGNTNAKKITSSGIVATMQENLIENFQVAKFSDLIGEKDAPSIIYSEDIGKLEISNGSIDFAINHTWLQELGNFSNILYLESPIYWKLKKALENIRVHPRYWRRRQRLSGVPGYFYDLVSALGYKYTGDIAFPEIYERLTSKDVLGGKITMSEIGDLSFQENGRSFSMPVTATGVTNLGMLALLIERKVLDKDAFIFIDEPEAHLHPAWQVVMAETLFELAKGGVNVVIATHSADILKWLEVHIKKNPDDESLVALNKFPVQEDDEQEFKYKMAAIKRELTKPFADLYTAGL